jgi:hypothetical protein
MCCCLAEPIGARCRVFWSARLIVIGPLGRFSRKASPLHQPLPSPHPVPGHSRPTNPPSFRPAGGRICLSVSSVSKRRDTSFKPTHFCGTRHRHRQEPRPSIHQIYMERIAVPIFRSSVEAYLACSSSCFEPDGRGSLAIVLLWEAYSQATAVPSYLIYVTLVGVESPASHLESSYATKTFHPDSRRF